MKTILVLAGAAAAVIVLAVAIMAAIGWMLPKAHTARRTAFYHRTPEALFAAITDFPGASTWRHDLQRVETLDPVAGLPRFREHGRHGSVTMEVVERIPPRRLVVRIADPGLPFGGRWIYEIAPAPDGATLTITEEGEVYNPIFRFVSRFFLDPHATMDAYLHELGVKFGEAPVLS